MDDKLKQKISDLSGIDSSIDFAKRTLKSAKSNDDEHEIDNWNSELKHLERRRKDLLDS